MERFPLETASDLAANAARSLFARELYETPAAPELAKCESCWAMVPETSLQMVLERDENGVEQPMFVCAECKAIEQEDAPCTCHQTDVDLFDARGCLAHDADSALNLRRREITSVQRYEERQVA